MENIDAAELNWDTVNDLETFDLTMTGSRSIVEGKYVIVKTNCWDDRYHGFGTFVLWEPKNSEGLKDERRGRFILVQKDHVLWQTGRIMSGGYWCEIVPMTANYKEWILEKLFDRIMGRGKPYLEAVGW